MQPIEVADAFRHLTPVDFFEGVSDEELDRWSRVMPRDMQESNRSRSRSDGPARETDVQSQPVTFLQKLRPGGPWSLTAIVPDGMATPISITARNENEVEEFVRAHNNKRNLYYSVNPTRTARSKKAEKTDIAAIEYVLGDLDPAEGEPSAAAKARYLDKLKTFEPEPTAVIDSGNGIQVLWRLGEPIVLGKAVDGKFWAEDQAKIVDVEERSAAAMRALGGKAGTQNIDRILRLPGTTNLPNKKKLRDGRVACPTALIEFNDASYPLALFPREERPVEQPCAPSEERDESGSGYGFRFMQDCHGRGLTFEQARAAILKDEGKAGSWAKRVDERQLKRAWERSGPDLTPIFWDAAELRVSFDNIPHRQWLYGTYLVRGEITVVAAPGGVGKTALTTAMAMEIATGKELLEEQIWGRDLKVLVINGEDGTTEMNRRLWACFKAHAHLLAGQSLDRLHVVGADDPRVQRLSFLRSEGNASVLDVAGFTVLKAALTSIRPDVLMLDPLVAFCAGGNMNDNSVMSLVMRGLKRLAAEFNCAILIVHHTKKGGERGDAEAVSGAAAIVNLARRAMMPVPMTEAEATQLGVLPSQRFRYFRVVDAKSNFAPRSADSPWYELHSVELPNAEPPTYPIGDNVQAVARVSLPLPKTASDAANDRKIQRSILDLADRGKLIDGKQYPYSPHLSGANNKRALLEDAMAAVREVTLPKQWREKDLKAVVQATIKLMKKEGWLYEEEIKKRPFRQALALRVNWQLTPWPNSASPISQPTTPADKSGSA